MNDHYKNLLDFNNCRVNVTSIILVENIIYLCFEKKRKISCDSETKCKTTTYKC